ncbi:ARP2/3 actin-organizing complex subunit Sop2 [Coniosporium tulheliwenetii]|uniref:ARP2/3 actin-organizing complex subunit Sop2 n=1 Tax=Coniosporium tulheliwenetii TaxID=3383036 RepID=A0ACC2YH54_9PEZI|nr:ARP2/3 actin-organizing complex subunit Sop2 [Cladosporium sp. JES 115]
MAPPEVHHLFHAPIADHSFSADRQTLAVARDSNVELYAKSGNKLVLQDELKGHDKTVTGVDIAPGSGKIVTCSQDRNAYVWEPTGPSGAWKPTLVLLRINRAATSVRWSPSETKFAVGSGARTIAVCYFESENDWWVSKHLKKPIRSTVTSVAWHPNSVLLGAGSTDGHARVFSSFVKGVDERPEPSYLNNTAGWVHDVAFSPSGDALAFASHDSSVTVVYPAGPDQAPRAVVSVSTQLLPFVSLIWSSESEIIAAGYDCEAYRLQGSEQGWAIAGSIESGGRPGLKDQREESALNMFRQMDLKGKSRDDTQLKTVHQNTISTVRSYAESGDSVRQFSTSGVDGRGYRGAEANSISLSLNRTVVILDDKTYKARYASLRASSPRVLLKTVTTLYVLHTRPSAIHATMQRSTEGEAAPPPYQETSLARFSDFAALGADDHAKARLRAFLAHVLSVDYALRTPNSLPSHEWCHWVRLARIERLLRAHVRNWDTASKEDAVYAHYFHHHVVLPSLALGISVEYTITVLRLFPLTAAMPEGR